MADDRESKAASPERAPRRELIEVYATCAIAGYDEAGDATALPAGSIGVVDARDPDVRGLIGAYLVPLRDLDAGALEAIGAAR
jgi:hypothetical protein